MGKLENGLLVVGPGRSGTTLLANWLALHPEIAWLNNWNNHFPKLGFLGFLGRIQRCSFVERLNRGRTVWPRPAEAHAYWDHYFPDPKIKREEALPAPELLKQCQQQLRAIRNFHGGKVLMTKMTGVCRWSYFQHVFDAPHIVWIDRHPIAVISSMMKSRWFFKDQPDKFEKMTVRDRLDFYISFYDQIQQTKGQYPKEKFLNVTYDQMIQNPEEVLKQICGHIGLTCSEDFINRIATWEIKQVAPEHYQKHYSPEDWTYLSNRLQKELP
jgi:hypothetical protein